MRASTNSSFDRTSLPLHGNLAATDVDTFDIVAENERSKSHRRDKFATDQKYRQRDKRRSGWGD